MDDVHERVEGLVDLLDLPEPSPGEIVAIGTPVYESMKRDALHGFVAMMMEIAREYPRGNVWYLKPHNDRLTWPFSCYWIIRAMLAQEAVVGRKADWLLYIEDDVVVPSNLFEMLWREADADMRPFVAAIAHSRYKPYKPGVTEIDPEAGRECQWEATPFMGLHRVATAPLCATLMHRSLFDRVPQPWFDPPAPIIGQYGVIGPAKQFCKQMRSVGIDPYVCCDVTVKHLGQPPLVGRDGPVCS